MALVENALRLLKDEKLYVPFIKKIKCESKRTKWDTLETGDL